MWTKLVNIITNVRDILLNGRGSKAPGNDLESYLFTSFNIDLLAQLIAIGLYRVNRAVITEYAQLPSEDSDQLSCYLSRNNDFPAEIIELVAQKLQKEAPGNAD